jgi:hypothetical protein
VSGYWLFAAMVQVGMAAVNVPAAFGPEHHSDNLIAFTFCLAMAVVSLVAASITGRRQ